jgi:predicted DNA-binding ribbon-helix-helix protein
MTLRSKPSTVVKRSIVISGHKTSVSLEDAFWVGLKACAAAEHQTLSVYIGAIDIDRKVSNLSSTLRLHVLAQATAERDALLETQAHESRIMTRPDDASSRAGRGFLIG